MSIMIWFVSLWQLFFFVAICSVIILLLVLFRFWREIMLNQQGINHAGLREEKFQHHHLRSVETFHWAVIINLETEFKICYRGETNPVWYNHFHFHPLFVKVENFQRFALDPPLWKLCSGSDLKHPCFELEWKECKEK